MSTTYSAGGRPAVDFIEEVEAKIHDLIRLLCTVDNVDLNVEVPHHQGQLRPQLLRAVGVSVDQLLEQVDLWQRLRVAVPR
jgi:hypothetical protein